MSSEVVEEEGGEMEVVNEGVKEKEGEGGGERGGDVVESKVDDKVEKEEHSANAVVGSDVGR